MYSMTSAISTGGPVNTSRSLAMCGLVRRDSAHASLRKRSTLSGEMAASGCRTLIADPLTGIRPVCEPDDSESSRPQ